MITNFGLEVRQMNKQIDYRLIVYCSVVMFLYILGIEYAVLGQLMGVIAFLICIIYLVLNKPEMAFLHFLLNLTMSIESTLFATGYNSGVIVYSFIILPFITIYGVILINTLIFFEAILKRKGHVIKIGISRNLKPKFLMNYCSYIFGVGFIMLIFTILMNDNGIASESWYFESIKSELFRMLMLVLTILNSLILLNNVPGFYQKLSKWMIAMICSLSLVGILTEVFDIHGYRMGQTNVSALPLFAFFGIGLISFIKTAQNKKDKIAFAMFTFSLLVVMILKSTPLGGKWFIAVLLVLIFMMYTYLNSIKGLVISLGIIVLLIVLVNNPLIEVIFKDNDYMLQKFTEFKTIFQYSANLDRSDASVAFRLDEIKNVWIEISKNPIYLFFGKGIVGTTIHHTSSYSWSAIGTFSEVQSNAGVYFQMHESTAIILLKYGLVGIIGFMYSLLQLVKAIKFSPWATIGFLWLVFYFDVYNSLLFGAVSMVLALFEYNNNSKSLSRVNNL